MVPYHSAIESIFSEREQRGITSIAISIHSMTDRLAGSYRPRQISFSSHGDRKLADAMIDVLRRSNDIEVGNNQPYSMDPAIDFSIPFHAVRRNLRYLQVEFRQDEVADEAGQLRWAERFAEALLEVQFASHVTFKAVQ